MKLAPARYILEYEHNGRIWRTGFYHTRNAVMELSYWLRSNTSHVRLLRNTEGF